MNDISFSEYKFQAVANERRESILKYMRPFFFLLSTSFFFLPTRNYGKSSWPLMRSCSSSKIPLPIDFINWIDTEEENNNSKWLLRKDRLPVHPFAFCCFLWSTLRDPKFFGENYVKVQWIKFDGVSDIL